MIFEFAVEPNSTDFLVLFIVTERHLSVPAIFFVFAIMSLLHCFLIICIYFYIIKNIPEVLCWFVSKRAQEIKGYATPEIKYDHFWVEIS